MNKKGFTLIEVLAIIIILAIIAVITVPLILNTIEDSRKGAAKDSAYGYIESVNRLYLSNSLNDEDSDIDNGYYTVSELKNMGLSVKGKEPIGDSWVKIVDNEVIKGCLQFGKYKNDIVNGEVSNVLKGECDSLPPEPVAFETDSWATIKRAIDDDNTDLYSVGDTKAVEIDGVSYSVRLVNKSTPAQCSTQGFSQTACGYVFEFANTIVRHRMNPYTTNGGGNKGGWEYSELREYINDDIYNSLPKSLKDVITDTVVVTGHGINDTSNFITIDKLYLLSTTEIIRGDSGDSAISETRILDYYLDSDYNIRRKSGVTSNWWLRTAMPGSDKSFIYMTDGLTAGGEPWYDYGVAPAFRIVKD